MYLYINLNNYNIRKISKLDTPNNLRVTTYSLDYAIIEIEKINDSNYSSSYNTLH